jgi:hypothetical protein
MLALGHSCVNGPPFLRRAPFSAVDEGQRVQFIANTTLFENQTADLASWRASGDPAPQFTLVKARPKQFRVVLMDLSLGQETLHLGSEMDLVTALQARCQDKAPIEMTYSDGAPIEREVMDRIHRRLFVPSEREVDEEHPA